jgi:hypothetical protein
MRRRPFLFSFGALAVSGALRAEEQARPPLFLEGYADRVSYVPGETVSLHVSSSMPTYNVEIKRLGASPKVVWKTGDITGSPHPIPVDASSHGCRWPVGPRWTIPASCESGYYQVTFSASDGGGEFVGRGKRTIESSCFFIVRAADPGSTSKILIQLTTNTYNAYNNYGGFSLYAYHARNKLQGRRVSYERPPLSQFSNWELPFVSWAERNGYTLEYAANPDLEFHPEILKQYRLVLSVGHDEYWSKPMRDNLEAFIGNGGNVAFFSGNTCCWQVRSEDDGRALTCWKQAYNTDPYFNTKPHDVLSTLWSHHLVGRPENSLTGVGFLHGGYHLSHGQYMDGTGAYNVHRPDHWLFEGTGLKPGDSFGGKHTIVGYECDGCEMTTQDGLPVPTHRDGTPDDFTILASAPARWHPDDCEWYDDWQKGREGSAVVGTYTRNGTVVTVGSTDWAHGLRGGDPVTERITKNVLKRLGT